MRQTVRELYEGDSARARWFRIGLSLFDVITIAYFLWTATADLNAALIAVDLSVGAVVLLDVLARFWIAERRLRLLLSLPTLADIIVILSLLAPLVAGSNLGFLRVLRVLRIIRSFHLVGEIDRLTKGIDLNRRVIRAGANLAAFIFVVTSLVWVWERGRNPDLNSYLDALYFTITTLTTTGYGDIILTDNVGRFLTIAIMIFGVGFFLQLVQALYRPDKVEKTCETCGLGLHDHDASQCKHCGETIFIETEGET